MKPSAAIIDKVKILSLDFGNFELKSFDGTSIIRIRSLQKPLAKGERSLKTYDDSPIIEMDGQRWHVGRQCSDYTSSEATVIGDKAQLAQLHLAACINESGIYKLVVSHHSPDEYSDFLKSALVGIHNYTRNGKKVSVKVVSVDVIPEGLGAYHLARLRSYVPARGYTCLIDLGGSTWLSTIYKPNGEIVAHDAYERQGTFALASSIAKDERLSKPLIEQFSVSAPDAITVQSGFTQTHYYGDSELCWADWLPEYLDPWWKGIVQTLKAKYQAYLPNIKRFLITGGGSNLITHKVAASPLFLVMPDASTANVVGAFHYASDDASIAA